MDAFFIFQSIIDQIAISLWQLFLVWWWFLLPAFFYFPAKYFYLWWIHWEIWYKELEWVQLELIPPSEILKPFRAMEDFFTSIWPIWDSPNWREVWCEGELRNGPFWAVFEIVSFAGEIHFYLRILKDHRANFESILQAHFPDIEIREVSDYIEGVPRDLPNKDFEMYGEDYILRKEAAYPLRTYKFFEIRPEETEEEKRVDSLPALMEAMAKLKKGEQLWLQMIIAPITNDDVPWVTEGRRVADKIARRVVAGPDKSITGEAFRLLAFDKAPFATEEKKEEVIPPEMKLTPGEREILGAVEEKISKHGFRTNLRSVYIAERKVFFPPNGKILRAYLMHFATQHMNSIIFWGRTRPKIHYLFRKRRVYARKRRLFRNYINRFSPLYPNRLEGGMILNAEELASLFHLPGKSALLPPGVPRVAAKKVVPPLELPMGDDD